MSDIETFDDLEAGLSRAFHREPLPVAPDRLRDGLIGVVAAGTIGARGRASRRSTLGLLGLAAVLVVGGAIALSGGGERREPLPSTQPGIGGGTRIPYEPQWSAAVPATPEARAELVRVLRTRLVAAGLPNASVEDSGAEQLVVDLPPAADVEATRQLLSTTGVVAFVPLGQEDVPVGKAVDLALHLALFDGTAILSASMGSGQTGDAVLNIFLRPDAANAFGAYTAAHVGDSFAITVDGVVAIAPRINSAIPGGQIEIGSPDLGSDALRRIAELMTSGPLPVRIVEVSVEPEGSSSVIPSASPAPTTDPTQTLQTPEPELDCPQPLGLPDELACADGIDTALASLPTDHPPIARITFSHDCQDVGAVAADCLVQAFGRILIEFADGDRLTIEVSIGSRPRLLHGPVATDPPTLVTIDAADAPLSCATPVSGPSTVTMAINPGSPEPVQARTPDGRLVAVRFPSGFLMVTNPVRLVVEGRAGQAFGLPIVFRDGEVVTIDAPDSDRERGPWPMCFGADGSVIVLGPATGA